MTLYTKKGIIWDHFKELKFYGHLESPEHTIKGTNPLCGDEITLFATEDPHTHQWKFSFTAKSCLICRASASLFATSANGMDSATIHQACLEFTSLTHNKKIMKVKETDPAFADFWNKMKPYPTRYKCALLPWKTWQDYHQQLREEAH